MPSATTSTTSSNASLADKLDVLAAKLNASAKSLRSGTEPSPQEHEKLVMAIKATADAVTSPADDLTDMQLGFVKAAAIRLLIQWKVFEHIPSEGFITYKELAEKVGGDVVIISNAPT